MMKSVIWVGTHLLGLSLLAAEYHVAISGNNENPGTRERPLRTIQRAADLAQPGDVITVHAGEYRERINPPRGGESDAKRITYQAAPGEKVTLKGSEVVKGWELVQDDTWKITLPNRFFGDFNPYRDVIHGDWFSPQGRVHHTGAVYWNGHWLVEAVKLDDVLRPIGNVPLWFTDGGGGADYLLNVAWLRPGKDAAPVPAVGFVAKSGTQNAICAEGGECVGFIRDGNWLRYERVNFGVGTENLEIRAASVTGGGRIEVRLDQPEGELLGTCSVADTGDWQKWASFTTKIKPTRGIKTLCLVFRRHEHPINTTVTIWAQFKGSPPNDAGVEINVRPTVFTPKKTGINYLTVRGFTMCHAASNWAPPTAGQFGLISAYWCKGWIIENNEVSYSKCSGIALGKHGDEFDNKSADSAEGYVETIKRAYKNGWTRENIGHHLVRNNHIHHCEQTGIVGSMGSAFSTIRGNEIHDIYVLKLFTGAEMGGIKFHAAVDTEISGNHIYRCGAFGLWLDWMTQGTRVIGNLMHENGWNDIFLEVNHGPFVVANNLFLSGKPISTMSNGGAFAHNLANGPLNVRPEYGRETPYLEPHATQMVQLKKTEVGDDRWFNNLFLGAGGLRAYDDAKLPVFMGGNVFLNSAVPSKHEAAPLVKPRFDPVLKFTRGPDGICQLEITLDTSWATEQTRKLVTTETLGKALIPNLAYELPDGSPLKVDTDYFGSPRNAANAFPGPFEISEGGRLKLKVWPIEKR